MRKTINQVRVGNGFIAAKEVKKYDNIKVFKDGDYILTWEWDDPKMIGTDKNIINPKDNGQ